VADAEFMRRFAGHGSLLGRTPSENLIVGALFAVAVDDENAYIHANPQTISSHPFD
jgi:hypothetical protein